MTVKPLKRDDGTPYGFFVGAASFSRVCDTISRFSGLEFTRRRRFFWSYQHIRAEFTFKDCRFRVTPDEDDDFVWVLPEDEDVTCREIDEIRNFVERHLGG